MSTLALEPKVLSLANTLGIKAENAVTGIRDYCAKRIGKFIRGAPNSINDIRELQKLVCEKLYLTIHEVWSDSELQRIVDSYVTGGDAVFAYLPRDLDAGTYGVLFRLNRRIGKQCTWAAVVDCRGEKRHRRFFTAWH